MVNFLFDIMNDFLKLNIVLIFDFDFIFLIIKFTILKNFIGFEADKL